MIESRFMSGYLVVLEGYQRAKKAAKERKIYFTLVDPSVSISRFSQRQNVAPPAKCFFFG